MKYKQKVGANNIRFTRQGVGNPILFLHGFGIPSRHYRKVFQDLAKNNEVIAPDMYGINYLTNQPISINEYAELTHELQTALKIGPCIVAGHSLGGTVGFTMATNSSDITQTIGINPTLPVAYGTNSFLRKSIYKGIRETLGLAGGFKSVKFGLTLPLPFAFNLARNFKASSKTVADICAHDYSKIEVTQPSTILYGTDDEFFQLTQSIEEKIKRSFKNLDIKKIKKMNHDWPIFWQRYAASLIHKAIREKT
jgi:pimeloyl-ACP methyl ester carboxylesterase